MTRASLKRFLESKGFVVRDQINEKDDFSIVMEKPGFKYILFQDFVCKLVVTEDRCGYSNKTSAPYEDLRIIDQELFCKVEGYY